MLEFDNIVDKETRGKLHYLANIISMSMTANEEANDGASLNRRVDITFDGE